MKIKLPKLFSRKQSKKNIRKISDSTSEIWGLLILSMGILLFIAILTYNQADPDVIATIEGNQYQAKNFLGLVGAFIAGIFFELSFGYGALIFPFLFMILGVLLMIDEPIKRMSKVTWVGLGWAYFISIVLAMPETLRSGGKSVDYFPSGLIGGFTSDFITQYIGKFALVFLTSVFLLVLLMLTFDFRLSSIPRYIIRKVLKAAYLFSVRSETIVLWLKNVKFFKGPGEKKGIYNRAKRKRKNIPEKPESQSAENESVIKFSNTDINNLEESTSNQIDSELLSPDSGRFTERENEDFLDENQPKELGEELTPDAYLFPNTPLGENEISPLQENGEPEFNDIAGLEFHNLNEPAPEIEIIDFDKLNRKAMAKFQLPPLELLNKDESEAKISREELMANADLLENTLAQFNVKAFVKKVIEGPVITLYAVRPAEGVKINQIVSLADDLALAMRAKGIRMIAPIPGEAAIGIEIPNRRPSTVFFKSIVHSEKFAHHRGQLNIGMGKTIGGEVFCADLTKMPHLLIAGSTGSGKSVGINTIIASILYRVPPSDVKFVLIDPKKLELSLYTKLKNHYLATCQDIDEIVITHPQNAVLILKSVVNEMEERYDILAKAGVRDIIAFNKKLEIFEKSGEKTKEMRRLPYIIVIIDELADLILSASREVEEPITRLAQMARAVGIHLIVATQRPSVDILTGLIKANFPTRIAYQVATRPDSKVILDMYGAEKLIGNGDMLFLPPGTGKPVRLQNPFISTEEVEAMIGHIALQPAFPPYELKLIREKLNPSQQATKMVNQDELFQKAKEIVIRFQQGSVSLLQRKLKIGYARAGRLMDSLEEAGIVGPGLGSKARDVLVSSFGDE